MLTSRIRPVNSDQFPLMFIFLYIICHLISAVDNHPTGFRCSHIPPTPDNVNHVWLSDPNVIVEEEQGLADDYIQGRVDSGNREAKSEKSAIKRLTRADKNRTHDRLLTDFRKREHSSTLARSDLVPMKIQVHYDESVSSLETKKHDLIVNEIIPTVQQFFESVLSIRRDFTIETFRISRRCPNNTVYYARDVEGNPRPYCMDRCENHAICGEMVVPAAHLAGCSYCNSTSKRCLTDHSSGGKGVADAQLLLYVSAKQTARCRRDQTIAYAAHCSQDSKTDRPVAGHANLCPNSISTDPKDLKSLVATVKHELTHVLGFSVSLFAYYRDQYGRPLTERSSLPGPIAVDSKTGYAKWSDRVIKKVIWSNWLSGDENVNKEAHLIVTPTVVREVREHFNCSTLEGAELEDQGLDGTSMTHWEKRLFENEAMTGTHTQNSVYSRLTLAVLQDTGWYVANFSRAERLEWGKNLGCDFAKQSCKSWIINRRAKGLSIKPFCDRVKGDLLRISCSEDRSSKAVCNMKYYKEALPPAYQNFDHLEGVPSSSLAHFGGSVDLADYCPFIQEFTWQAHNLTVRGSKCEHGSGDSDSEKSPSLEYYGPEAKCFEHGRRWEQRSCIFKRNWYHYGAGCYKYSCSKGRIIVTVGNQTYDCFYPNQLLRVEQLVDQWLYNGTLLCPACEKLCPASQCSKYDGRVIDEALQMSSLHYSNSSDHNEIDTPDDRDNLIERQDDLNSMLHKKIIRQLHRMWNGSLGIFSVDNHLEAIKDISQKRTTSRNVLQCSSSTSWIQGTSLWFSCSSILVNLVLLSRLAKLRYNIHFKLLADQI